ncbi:hypothetical protein NL676_020913 [Syzygium grande]|nr:hypothetical protein NL676_020913 [Syzygium grande]
MLVLQKNVLQGGNSNFQSEREQPRLHIGFSPSLKVQGMRERRLDPTRTRPVDRGQRFGGTGPCPRPRFSSKLWNRPETPGSGGSQGRPASSRLGTGEVESRRSAGLTSPAGEAGSLLACEVDPGRLTPAGSEAADAGLGKHPTAIGEAAH